MFTVSPLLGDRCRLLLSVAFVLACSAKANRPWAVYTEISCKICVCVCVCSAVLDNMSSYKISFIYSNKRSLSVSWLCLFCQQNYAKPLALIAYDSMRYAFHNLKVRLPLVCACAFVFENSLHSYQENAKWLARVAATLNAPSFFFFFKWCFFKQHNCMWNSMF